VRALVALLDRLIIAALVVLAVLWAVPVIWVFALSLKPDAVLARNLGGLLGPPFTLGNYANAIAAMPLPGWMLHSTMVAVWQTLLTLVVASLAGYGFARTNFPGKRLLYVVTLAALLVPEAATIVPLQTMFASAGLLNTYTALILPRLALPFGVLLMTQHFKAVSPELEEAALLDNAPRFLVFWRIVLPLSLPALAALGAYTFISAWNDLFWPLVSATDPDIYTLTVGLASLQMSLSQTAGIGSAMAQAILGALPMVVVYLFFQRYVIAAVSEWAAD
jgi:multiple sugar transport system permease protein